MHELSVAKALVENLTKIKNDRGYEKVHGVTIEVGCLSGIVSESLAFCFPIMTQGTVFERTRLTIDVIPIKMRCAVCSGETASENLLMQCPSCLSSELNIFAGRELNIKSMEVD